MDTGRKLKALEKAFGEHLYATRKLSLWENRTLGLLSRPGETEADFRTRCRAAAEEQAKQAVEMEKGKISAEVRVAGREPAGREAEEGVGADGR